LRLTSPPRAGIVAGTFFFSDMFLSFVVLSAGPHQAPNGKAFPIETL
jgi:hypothetical protein